MLLAVIFVLSPAPATADAAVPFCNSSSCGWTFAQVPTNVSSAQTVLSSVTYVSAKVLVAVGYQATILRSTDGGRSWGSVPDPVASTSLLTLARDPSGTLWAAGNSGVVLRSLDQGLSWSILQVAGLSGNITTLAFPDLADSWFAYAGTSQGLFTSRDRGNTWSGVASPVGDQLRSVAFFDPDHGWIEGGPSPGQVYYTSDGGATWEAGVTGGQGTVSSAIAALGPTSAWMLGVKDMLFESSDGTNWSGTQLTSGQRSHALFVEQGRYGWVGAEDANLFYTSDAGSCWVEEGVPQIPEIYSFSFYNTTWGVASGDGVMWYTTDAGLSSADVPGVDGQGLCGATGTNWALVSVIALSAVAGLLAASAFFVLLSPRRRKPDGERTEPEHREHRAMKGRGRYRSRKRFVNAR
ncbi:MAG: hypothetical protein KGJ23_06500 [Euryarchaeota archaeon]|nr:hypothetical protein [Euryarchaeota archaeon]MDE1881627.1 hypothetical protein [Euryarchaeota archaeon]MDE2044988.1 hypothetical protein [Thermoplasmata archaeon]